MIQQNAPALAKLLQGPNKSEFLEWLFECFGYDDQGILYALLKAVGIDLFMSLVDTRKNSFQIVEGALFVIASSADCWEESTRNEFVKLGGIDILINFISTSTSDDILHHALNLAHTLRPYPEIDEAMLEKGLIRGLLHSIPYVGELWIVFSTMTLVSNERNYTHLRDSDCGKAALEMLAVEPYREAVQVLDFIHRGSKNLLLPPSATDVIIACLSNKEIADACIGVIAHILKWEPERVSDSVVSSVLEKQMEIINALDGSYIDGSEFRSVYYLVCSGASYADRLVELGLIEVLMANFNEQTCRTQAAFVCMTLDRLNRLPQHKLKIGANEVANRAIDLLGKSILNQRMSVSSIFSLVCSFLGDCPEQYVVAFLSDFDGFIMHRDEEPHGFEALYNLGLKSAAILHSLASIPHLIESMERGLSSQVTHFKESIVKLLALIASKGIIPPNLALSVAPLLVDHLSPASELSISFTLKALCYIKESTSSPATLTNEAIDTILTSLDSLDDNERADATKLLLMDYNTNKQAISKVLTIINPDFDQLSITAKELHLYFLANVYPEKINSEMTDFLATRIQAGFVTVHNISILTILIVRECQVENINNIVENAMQQYSEKDKQEEEELVALHVLGCLVASDPVYTKRIAELYSKIKPNCSTVRVAHLRNYMEFIASEEDSLTTVGSFLLYLKN